MTDVRALLRVLWLLSFSVCGWLAACSQPADVPAAAATPEKAVRAFYTLRTRTASTGLPSDAQLAELRPYLSDELYGLLSGVAARSKDSAQHDERSFVDGDVFSSLFDGPTTFIVGDIRPGPGDEHIVAVQFTAARQLPAMRWVDHVSVIREHDRYVIADVRYADHWSPASRPTLLETLKQLHKPVSQ